MAEKFIGQIFMFGGNFAIRSTAFCGGAIMQINQNTTLYSIIGTTYGGDGRTTMALPDLVAHFPIGTGNGSGLTARQLGQKGGAESVPLSGIQMPIHSHDVVATATGLPTNRADGASWAKASGVRRGASPMLYGNAPDASFSSSTGENGLGKPHSNVSPLLAVSFLIALHGAFPSRN